FRDESAVLSQTRKARRAGAPALRDWSQDVVRVSGRVKPRPNRRRDARRRFAKRIQRFIDSVLAVSGHRKRQGVHLLSVLTGHDDDVSARSGHVDSGAWRKGCLWPPETLRDPRTRSSEAPPIEPAAEVDIGAELAEARRRRSLSLTELSRRTKLSFAT